MTPAAEIKKLRKFVAKVAAAPVNSPYAADHLSDLRREAELLVVRIEEPKSEARGRAAATVNKARGIASRAEFYPLIRQAVGEGAKTHRQVAAWLNERGYKTPRGSDWKPGSVQNIHPEPLVG